MHFCLGVNCRRWYHRSCLSDLDCADDDVDPAIRAMRLMLVDPDSCNMDSVGNILVSLNISDCLHKLNGLRTLLKTQKPSSSRSLKYYLLGC